jgi:hypothetical protein
LRRIRFMNKRLRRRVALPAMHMIAIGLLLQPLNMSAAKAQGSPAKWTMVGSAGTVDEDSLGIVDLRNFTVGLADTKTGTVTVRYDITAVRGLTCTPVTDYVVTVRYRDSDGLGTTAQVKFDIRSTDSGVGGNRIEFTFDSNIFPSTGSAFQSIGISAVITPFDFANRAYWIEAQISRSDPSAFANLGSIGIFGRNGGVPCPA